MSQEEIEPQEEFITNEDVDQEIVLTNDGTDLPLPEEEEEEEEVTEQHTEHDGDIAMGEAEGQNGEDIIEIDMSNNSVSYFDKHTDSVFTISHHPTLPLICTGGGDNVAHLWTSHSHPPKFAGTLQGHTESVIASGFTMDGKFLITGDMNGKILLHKSNKSGSQWKQVSQLQEVDEVVWLKCHPTVPGIFAFGAADGSVWCYQINDNGSDDVSLEQLMSGFAHQQDCTMGEFINLDKAANGESLELISCSLDSSIVGWNCFTGQQLFKITPAELKGLQAPWVSLSLAPSSLTNGNSGIIAAGANNGVLAIINCNNNGAILQLSTVIELKPEQEELDASIESIAWSQNFPLMALGLVSGEILLYDTTTWRVRHKFVLDDSITKLIFDNNDLFASCINGKVYQYDSKTGQEKFVCTGHNMGVLDFVLIKPQQNSTTGLRRLVTAGDEGVSLVFEVPN
ncbi:Sqt1p NDAI_0B01710 [Naumovozyma dairenensis CBS 421]|uniref:Uncharacterized protein n=1 Tax=Naumovozyma dairenensis (strain ATCC 10597 / BCRC 20456 / CBS 421 / NBRC 0211 / NRRL Y-12639) TaxID=1071378 RepID=G0W5Z4_NAUDC|nr:hypothetical protein NDAI_0B01710 [Naumovozyma dairenensis CBS 421]CCD23205.1 hypothetical protein NDAI_0B01710 [Naumovozyma dairenensis CBS 421]